MKSSIRNMASVALLASALLLSATNADAACTFQPIAYGQTVNGSLSATDCTDDVNGSLYYADYYQFTGTAGDKIYIQQSSSSIDPWLMLTFPSGGYLTDNNGGGGTTARIPATSGYYTLLETGTYQLEATSNFSNTTGSYTLILAKEASATTLPSAPTNVTAAAGNGSAIVTFTPGSIGSGTLVKYWAACGIDTTHLITATGSNSPITVTGLTNGTVYYCWALTESTVGYSSSWSTASNPVTPTSSTQAGKNYSDSWWNANESGWGITITDHGTDAFVQWYTYDQTGHNQKYVIPGGIFSSDKCQFSGAIQHVTGPSWTAPTFDPNLVTRTTVGSGSFDFCPSGLADGTIVFNYTADGVTGSKPLTRLPFGNDVPHWGCIANTGANDFTGLWWNSSESGWGVSFTQHGSTAFFRAFVYDTDGRPLLFIVSSASVSNGGTTFTGPVTLTAGPWFGSNPFDPNQVVRTTAGTATLTFSDANNGVLSYTVNGITKTKSITRLAFGRTAPEVCEDGASNGTLSGNSPDQAKFIAARGYPHLFTVNFVTGVTSGGKTVQLTPPRRVETWVYNDANVTSALFDNGFFINQDTLGAHTSLKSTNLKPEMFTLGMTEAQVISVVGPPTCVDTLQMAGMSMRFLRYAATADSPVAAVGLIDGTLVSVSAGFLLGDRTDPGVNLCSAPL